MAVSAACGPAPDRHTYGDPSRLPGIDLDDAGEADAADTDDADAEPPPPSDDGGAADDGPPDPGPSDDGGAADDAPPDPTDGDDGVPDEPPTSPYIGGWDVGGCQDAINASGTGVGQVVPDFVLTDQHGDQVRLYDFCHKAVFLVAGAFW